MPIGRTDLVREIAQRLGMPQGSVADVVAAWESAVVAALRQGQDVRLPGFLTLETVERQARTGRNPRTGEPLRIPAGRAVRVTAGAALKAAVKEGNTL